MLPTGGCPLKNTGAENPYLDLILVFVEHHENVLYI